MSSQYEPRLRIVNWQPEPWHEDIDQAVLDAHATSYETGFIEGALLMLVVVLVLLLPALWWATT